MLCICRKKTQICCLYVVYCYVVYLSSMKIGRVSDILAEL